MFASAAGLALLAACSKSPSSPSAGASDSSSGSALQITASWDTTADVDLHVIEPSGVEIYWANTGPTASGGVLDGDADLECRTTSAGNKEVVHWNSSPPNGVYTVRLDYYSPCGATATNYTVTISDSKTTLPAVTGQFTGAGDVGNGGTTVKTFTHTGSSFARFQPPRALEPASLLAIFFLRG